MKPPEKPAPLHLHMAIIHGRMVRLARLVDEIDNTPELVPSRSVSEVVAEWRRAIIDFQAFLLDERDGQVPSFEALAAQLLTRLEARQEDVAGDDEDAE
jgi:hypothetical protein